jgi:hypothetical protein
MKPITLIYIVNASLLLLHEIESAYEKEWELLKLPGKINGFLLLHIPIILFILIGLIEIDKMTTAGLLIGIVLGVGGLIPFIVHKLVVRTPGQFSGLISNFIIFSNLLSGGILMFFSIREIL